ncbi:unnamed protein product [Ranitomeya imitator]|uniref:Uncharacterized protein n=1 Tax=Ranitomeya imitator TaxID=111125 RepID=A0ABN9LQI4_9NEOB|nr:unnamed protein product [Ranitomeya imitator]
MWEGQLSELLEFHQELNGIFPELGFTVTYSDERVQTFGHDGITKKVRTEIAYCILIVIIREGWLSVYLGARCSECIK